MMKTENDKRCRIHILVSAHQDAYVPKCRFLQPVQAGAALADHRFRTMLHDDEGEHISGKNKSYCELTVQYWAWKNLTADYYGFFHYRRYMNFTKAYPVGADGKLAVRHWKPYEEADSIRNARSICNLDETRMQHLIKAYDVLTVLSEQMNVSVYEQYCQFHSKADLDRMIGILKEIRPQYRTACDQYLHGKQIYFCNMYIMKRREFYAYMEWLFPLLEAFEAQTDVSLCSKKQLRTIGYLAERLFGIYYTQLKKNPDISCCELGYVIFHNTQPRQKLKPYFGRDSVCLVTASDHAFVPYLSVMLQSVMDHTDSGKNYDLIVIHADISPQYQKMVEKMAEEKPNVSIRFLDVSAPVKELGLTKRRHLLHFTRPSHISVETYFRYFMLDLLPGYEKALWLDADLIALTDISELYETSLQQYCVAAVRDLDLIGAYQTDAHVRMYVDQQLRLDHPYDYFQAGVMLLNLKKIREHNTTGDWFRRTMSHNWRMADQDVLNVVLQGQCLELDQKWNVLMDWQDGGRKRSDLIQQAPCRLWEAYEAARKAPAIVHYAGRWKPWMVPDCDFSAHFWKYARHSPFYEVILYACVPYAKFRVYSGGSYRRGFRLRPTRFTVAVDMRTVNRILPAGSLRRRIVRMICGGFLS